MAKTVDILRYVLGLDARPFRKEARRVDKDVRQLRGNVNKAGTAFGGLAKFVNAAALAFAALKLGNLIKDATLVAARIEVLNNVFQLTGNAAGKTNAELEFTKQKLIALGIAEKEALQIGLRFIQVQLDLADSLKIARAAQDLAVVAGTDSSTTALKLTEAIVKQRPILLKQFGIVANLDEIFGKMAATLGKNVKELTENERRTAFLNTILEKAKTVAGSYEKAMELVGKRLTSLPRLFQNAQQAVGQHFLPAMRVAVDGAGDFLKLITENFQTAEQGFTKSVFKFAEGFDKFAKVAPEIARLRDEFESLTKIQSRTEPQQSKLNKVIRALGNILPETRVVLRGYNDDLEGTRVALDAVIERNNELQKLELLDVLDEQAKAFRENKERLEAFQQTGSGGFGFVPLNIEADTKRVEEFTTSLRELTEEQISLQAQLDNPDRDKSRDRNLENRLKFLDDRIGNTEEALVNATKAVISYETEVARLNAANDAQITKWSQLFPNIKDNEVAVRLLTAANKELLDSIIELQEAQAVDLRQASLGPFDQPQDIPRPLFTPEEEFAEFIRREIVAGILRNKDNPELAAAARSLAAGLEFETGDFGITLGMIRRADSLVEFAKRRDALGRGRERRRNREEAKEKESLKRAEKLAKEQEKARKEAERLAGLPSEFQKEMAKATEELDIISGIIGIVDQQMGALVSKVADFTNALASGDILGQIGAGLGLLGNAFGLFGGGTDRTAEARAAAERAEEQQKRLIESNREIREAIDRWIASINEQTLAQTAEQRDILLQINSLFGEVSRVFDAFGALVPGSFLTPDEIAELFGDISGTEFVEEFDRLITELRAAGIAIPEGLGDTGIEALINLLSAFINDASITNENVQQFFDSLESIFGDVLTRNLLEQLGAFDAPDTEQGQELIALMKALLAATGLPEPQLEAAIAANTLGQMLEVLSDLERDGQLSLAAGQELIDFWKSFQNLSLEQEQTLLQNLLEALQASGDITPGSILDLLAALESLDEQIQAEKDEAAEEASGLTQIQRSVTTITEGQANIIAATLNSILVVLGLMDSKLGSIVNAVIGTESGGLLNGIGAPLATIPEFGFELPEVLASLRGIEEKLGSFLDRVAAQIGPTITVQAGAILITQNFPGVTSSKEVEDVTATAITEVLITDGRGRGIKI